MQTWQPSSISRSHSRRAKPALESCPLISTYTHNMGYLFKHMPWNLCLCICMNEWRNLRCRKESAHPFNTVLINVTETKNHPLATITQVNNAEYHNRCQADQWEVWLKDAGTLLDYIPFPGMHTWCTGRRASFLPRLWEWIWKTAQTEVVIPTEYKVCVPSNYEEHEIWGKLGGSSRLKDSEEKDNLCSWTEMGQNGKWMIRRELAEPADFLL